MTIVDNKHMKNSTFAGAFKRGKYLLKAYASKQGLSAGEVLEEIKNTASD